MIFRWSAWGNKSEINTLLYYSIFSFQRFFGRKNHKYLLFTDSCSGLSGLLFDLVDVHLFGSFTSQFDIASRTTWRKWVPSLRIDVSEAECYVDSDVFLLKPPDEIMEFLSSDTLKFCILDEFEGEVWQHGCFEKRPPSNKPFVNAGLFIQNRGADITEDLLPQFEWWRTNVPHDNQGHHDEQGALATALTKYQISGELKILPKDKYMLISKYQNEHKEDLNDVTLMHSTYPNHPAFFKFKDEMSEILKIGFDLG